MKNKSFKRRFLLLVVIVLLTLSACERPVPREDTPEVVDPAPTTDVIIIPTAPPEVDEAYPSTGEEQTGEVTTDPAAGETADTAVSTEETPAEETTGTTDDQAAVAAGGEVTHVVQAGETLGGIAEQYDVSIEDIVAANNIGNIDVLEVGQSLIIKAGAAAETPAPDTTVPSDGAEQVHVVQAGDNLFRIGLRYGFTPEELAAYNNIPDITRIDVGQVIKIPPK